MRRVIAAVRLLRLSVHVLHGLVLIKLRFPSIEQAAQLDHVKRWSGKTLRLLGVELQIVGDLPADGAKLLVANHISWLDIAAVHAVLPEARFVSKSDVRDWPIVGALVSGVGTLYIERSSKRDALRVVKQAADALKAGDTVAFFPEGTTGPGPDLLPFHGNLLQAAIATETPVQPLVIRWHEPGQRFSPAALFIGDTSLVQSLWAIADARGLVVQLAILPAHPTEASDERRALAERMREQIGRAL
jgi:1-acyl-sn-glycerol-3-phosphate acyltransferase